MNIPAKVLTMATSRMTRRTICACVIRITPTVEWFPATLATIQHQTFFICCTLASHSIPATDIPSSNTTVIQPTILMSFSSSTMMASCSWMQHKMYHEAMHDQMFPGALPSCHISHFTHLQQFNHRLCKSHHIHGDGHSVGKGKNQPNGASKLRP